MFGEEELVKFHKRRASIIGNIILISFSIILMRLWYLQVYKGEELHEYSVQNRLRKEVVWAPRGMFYDRRGELLVDNIPRFDAVLVPQFLQKQETTLKKLSSILEMNIAAIKKIIQKNSFQAKYRPVIIKKNISQREVALIETESSELPGISVNTFISREYRDGEIGAHLLGYISEISQKQLPQYKKRDRTDYRLGDFIGQFGIEQQYDKEIRGINGHEFVEVDALGRKKKYINTDNLFKGIKDRPSRAGHNLQLTIDRDLQKAGFEALEGKVGAVIALDIRTGEVLAMISRPSFDPSQFSRGLTPEYWSSLVSNEFNPLRDRNIQEHYSPGSTFKPYTAIAALEKDVITPFSRLRCHGTFRLGRKVYHSWKRWGTEQVSIQDALMQSCNIFFYKVATELDIDDLAFHAKLFGFGQRSGIALPREVSGLIPTREWKLKKNGIPWQLGETLSCAIGQSYVLASTLQLANAYATIANGGNLYRPFTVKKMISHKGELIQEFAPKLIRQIDLKESTWENVRQGLYKVVNRPQGTAWWRRGEGLQMAGKTGTSQVRSFSADKIYAKCQERDYKSRHHGLFVGFAPFYEPRIAAAAVVEHGCGSSAAVPVVAAVIEKYMSKYFPQEKEENIENEKKQFSRWLAAKKRAEEAKKEEESLESELQDET